jgi:hypothetical protein
MSSAAYIARIMEDASRALVRGEYLESESLCLRALQRARRERLWADYARILLPLQECRRHRRMIAAEGLVRLGTAGLSVRVESWLRKCRAGLIVVTKPHGLNDARALVAAARRKRRFIEVLLADFRGSSSPANPAAVGYWHLRTFAGSAKPACITRPAPQREWMDRWLTKGVADGAGAGKSSGGDPTPADWFLDAAEALGDAALAAVSGPRGSLARLQALENCLRDAGDHEILHQRLGDAAREMLITDK